MYILLQPCCGTLLMPPSTNKTSVLHPLQPLNENIKHLLWQTLKTLGWKPGCCPPEGKNSCWHCRIIENNSLLSVLAPHQSARGVFTKIQIQPFICDPSLIQSCQQICSAILLNRHFRVISAPAQSLHSRPVPRTPLRSLIRQKSLSRVF